MAIDKGGVELAMFGVVIRELEAAGFVIVRKEPPAYMNGQATGQLSHEYQRRVRRTDIRSLREKRHAGKDTARHPKSGYVADGRYRWET